MTFAVGAGLTLNHLSASLASDARRFLMRRFMVSSYSPAALAGLIRMTLACVVGRTLNHASASDRVAKPR
jgi:hypothetical protein